MRVAVLGASPKKERYSNMAVCQLLDAGHDVVPVNPGHPDVEGIPAVRKLEDIEPGSVETVTVYVNPSVSSHMVGAFLDLRPERVIFNPGAENPGLEEELGAAGIEVVEACTLVMLSSGQF